MSQLLDADLVLAFARKACVDVRSGIGKAIYEGLEQRIRRGDFNAALVPVLLDTDDPELVRMRADHEAWLYGQEAIDRGGETP